MSERSSKVPDMDGSGEELLLRQPFGIRFPGLVDAAHLSIDSLALAAARDANGGSLLVHWLGNNAGPNVADLLNVTEEDVLSWRNIGVGKRAQILDFLAAIDYARDDFIGSGPKATVHPAVESVQADPDLHLLIDWTQFAGPLRTWADVERSVLGQVLPADVTHALDRLRARRIPAPAPTTDAESVLAAWFGEMKIRDRDILQHRLVGAPPRTLEEIGSQHGVTRERIRQVQRKLTDKVPGLLATDEWRVVRWEVFAQQHRLGACAPLTLSEAEFLSSSEGFPRALILWLAGYERFEQTVRRRGFATPSAGTVPLLDGTPIVDRDALGASLVADGVHVELVDWLIDSVPGIARIDDEVVLWPSNIVEKSYAVLSVRGVPMTPDALAEAIGGGVSVRGLRGRLYEDDRVARVSAREVGLVAWGGEEYTSVPGLMTTYLEEHGPSSITDLQDNLEERFGASRASVAMVRAAPIFANRGQQIWLRGADEPFVPRNTSHIIPGHYRAGDRLVWRLKADRELMRGSGRSAPPEIAAFVGLQPGANTKLRATPRDVHFAWLMTSHVGPQMGSLKQLAEAEGIVEGDELFLVLDRSAHAAHVRPIGAAPTDEGLAAAIAHMTGLPLHACTSQEALATCVGVPASDLVDVLSSRGDTEVAELADRLPE